MIDMLLILRGFSELVKTFTNYLRQMCHAELTAGFLAVKLCHTGTVSGLPRAKRTVAKPVGFATV